MSVCDTDNGASDAAQLASSRQATGRLHCRSLPRTSSLYCVGRLNFGGRTPSSPFPSLSHMHTHTSPMGPSTSFSRRGRRQPHPRMGKAPGPIAACTPTAAPMAAGEGAMEKGGAEPPQRAVTPLGKRVRRRRRYIQFRGNKKSLSPRPASPPPHPSPAPFAPSSRKNKRRTVLKRISENLHRRESFPGEADVCSVGLAPPETC